MSQKRSKSVRPKWPRRWPRAGGGGEHTDGLLLSGQLVLDRSAGVADAHRFLCADLLALGGKAVAAQPLHKRLALLGAEVLEPRKQPGVDTSAEVLRERLEAAVDYLSTLTAALHFCAAAVAFLVLVLAVGANARQSEALGARLDRVDAAWRAGGIPDRGAAGGAGFESRAAGAAGAAGAAFATSSGGFEGAAFRLP